MDFDAENFNQVYVVPQGGSVGEKKVVTHTGNIRPVTMGASSGEEPAVALASGAGQGPTVKKKDWRSNGSLVSNDGARGGRAYEMHDLEGNNANEQQYKR